MLVCRTDACVSPVLQDISCCAHCGKVHDGEPTMASCRQCMRVRYCSGKCQRAAWPLHKSACQRMARATEEGGTIKDQLALFPDFLQVSDLKLSSMSYAVSVVCTPRVECVPYMRLVRHGRARVEDVSNWQASSHLSFTSQTHTAGCRDLPSVTSERTTPAMQT